LFSFPFSRLSVAESQFVECDFSGNYSYSFSINGGDGATAITHFDCGAFSSPIAITFAKATMFTAAQIGSTSFQSNSGFLNIVGSYAFSATVTGAGARSFAGNANLTYDELRMCTEMRGQAQPAQ
jgi:hypothetical protein